ncbi:hypothetical protein ACRALDRAFT_1070249 [Sodiomyces alcalophilus JCM 7366]|uniref:uncharacterized protein n=1 Tax=Sodiomyces alcalophilus JCM 7366 TaxID=591952 RepID=UPI0039B5B76E
MALHPPNDTSKLIFAPAGPQSNVQAPQFTAGPLHRSDLDPTSPTRQFHAWFAEAQRASAPSSGTPLVAHPETCTLATAHLPSGRVSARMVYLKELDAGGRFVVYSNFDTSRKADDLASNPRAALVFWWEGLQRQVRVEGATERLGAEESQVYFDTRVRGSRVGAWASRQSVALEPRGGSSSSNGEGGRQVEGGGEKEDDGRAQLEEWVREAEAQFDGQDRIPVPPHWGGLRIIPDRVEFWQGRENRLHDRFVYEREDGDDEWKLDRLSP